jgi:hypothetical protein|tara:strand:+ start:622 stop:1032 length:411 start_codon:yes stop_codon:yes gene_type:complete
MTHRLTTSVIPWIEITGDGGASVDLIQLYGRDYLDTLDDDILQQLADDTLAENNDIITNYIDTVQNMLYGSPKLFHTVAIMKDGSSRCYTFQDDEERDEYVECLANGAVKNVDKIIIVDSNLDWTEVEYESFYRMH